MSARRGGDDPNAPHGAGPGGDDADEASSEAPDELEAVVVGDVLDLHTFAPRDVPALVPDYLDECARLGLRHVRIIHGKGRGVLRRIVHAALSRHPRVVEFHLAGDGGGWGATVVELAPDSDCHSGQ